MGVHVHERQSEIKLIKFTPVSCGIVLYLQEELAAGEDVATCPSCSLIVRVIYDLVSSV